MITFIESIFYCVLLITSIIGFSYIFSILQKVILHSNNNFNMIIILPVSGHIENIELLIREIRAAYNDKKIYICFVDSGLDAETRAICNNLTRDFQNCTLCYEGQVPKVLHKLI